MNKKIAIIGATGMIGSRVLMELIAREYVITAISRNPFDLPGSTLIIACEGDVMDSKVVTGHVKALENEVLISVINPDPAHPETFVEAARNLVKIAEDSGIDKLITVGGAGSLLLPDGTMLMDSPDFPENFKAIARAHKEALEVYTALEGNKFNWINVSPAAQIQPDEKRGGYRIGKDNHLLQDASGRSFISAEDFASVVADLIEDETVRNQRITVAY